VLIARAPLRVGLVGGGSDLPDFFLHNPGGGAVLGMSISKYVYVTLLPLAEIARERFRFTYRATESVQSACEFEHPVLRAVLAEMPDLDLLNVGTMADLPGETGLGSSSAFTVALLHALLAVNGKELTPSHLARQAIRIEREVLGEAGGWQDQLQAAFGGMRLYEFDSQGFRVSDPLGSEKTQILASTLSLLYMTGQRRSHDAQVALEGRIRAGSANGPLSDLSDLARSTWNRLNEAEDPARLAGILADALNESSRLKAESTGQPWKGLTPTSDTLASKPLGAMGGSFTLLAHHYASRRDPGAQLEDGFLLPVSASLVGSQVTRF
jgi:D-glycero-alpha-D-manno-heptose-7-phosphate kinase